MPTTISQTGTRRNPKNPAGVSIEAPMTIVAQASGVRLFELRPTDESLESVFAYLVRPGGHRS